MKIERRFEVSLVQGAEERTVSARRDLGRAICIRWVLVKRAHLNEMIIVH